MSFWMRTIHRWLSAIFVVAVLLATYAAATGLPQENILYYLPLGPLFVLILTGLYMFITHYLRKARRPAA